MNTVTLPPINVNWAYWNQASTPNHSAQLPKPSSNSSISNSPTSPSSSPVSSANSSPEQPTMPVKKTKRGRKPCANPTPQALRQRAYRLRKQMKKQQQQQKEQSKNLQAKANSVVNEHLIRESDRLSDHEHFVAEILISLKSSPVLVQ